MDSSGGNEEYAFVSDLYDYVIPYRNRPDLTFYVEAAKESGGPILEVGCGTGRILIPTAREGVEIVGLDQSAPMLDVCLKRLIKEPEEVRSRVRLIRADMRNFELGRTFRLITIPFRPFQHLMTVVDQIACLGSIHRHQLEGDRLILDIFNPSLEYLTNGDVGEKIAEEPEFTTPNGQRVVRRHRVVNQDRFNQFNYVELIYNVCYPDGREERLVQSFPMRYLFRFEAEHLLARCGYEIEHVYADFDKSLYGSKYPGELIFVAKKVEG